MLCYFFLILRLKAEISAAAAVEENELMKESGK